MRGDPAFLLTQGVGSLRVNGGESVTQRKRATGFALMDTAFAADAKFVRLARKAPSEVAFATAVGVYWLMLADARRARNAAVNWEDYTEYTEQIALLKDAKLLIATGFDSSTFDRWAPAYKSPWDKERTGTQGYAEEPESTQATPTSTPLTSNQLSSPQLVSSELPNENDSATIACRSLADGGRWLGDREYVAAFDDMDRRYTAEWVQAAIPAVVADLTARGKVRAWDLKRLVDLKCAERARLEDNERQRKVAEANAAEAERLRRKAESATDEEKRRASVMRRAVGLWLKRRPSEPVPDDFDELAAWLEQNGEAA